MLFDIRVDIAAGGLLGILQHTGVLIQVVQAFNTLEMAAVLRKERQHRVALLRCGDLLRCANELHVYPRFAQQYRDVQLVGIDGGQVTKRRIDVEPAHARVDLDGHRALGAHAELEVHHRVGQADRAQAIHGVLADLLALLLGKGRRRRNQQVFKDGATALCEDQFFVDQQRMDLPADNHTLDTPFNARDISLQQHAAAWNVRVPVRQGVCNAIEIRVDGRAVIAAKMRIMAAQLFPVATLLDKRGGTAKGRLGNQRITHPLSPRLEGLFVIAQREGHGAKPLFVQHTAHQELVVAGGNGLGAGVNQAEPLTGPRHNPPHVPVSRRMSGLAENRPQGVLPLKSANQAQEGEFAQRLEQEHLVTIIPESLQVMTPRHRCRQTHQVLFAGRCKVRFTVAIANMGTVIDINKKNGILLHDQNVLFR
ncbi:hypothetical protein D3C77_244280 [compost metagenome]